MPRPLRIFLVDGHETARQAVAALLAAEPDLEVVGQASTLAEAMARIPVTPPDVVLLAARLPDGDGVAACRELTRRVPGLACLPLTSYAGVVPGTVPADAAGHVLGGDLPHAIRTVAAGDPLPVPATASSPATATATASSPSPATATASSPSPATATASSPSPAAATASSPSPAAATASSRSPAAAASARSPAAGGAPDPLRELTDRERRVLELLGQGLTNREIGAQLSLAEKTVKNYVTSVLAKLGLRRRTQAAALATEVRRPHHG
ncbi:MAG TPA: response regulator transcription factor [Pseudonocardiaceae bacterium]